MSFNIISLLCKRISFKGLPVLTLAFGNWLITHSSQPKSFQILAKRKNKRAKFEN